MASKCIHEGAVSIDCTASTSDSVLHLQQCIQYHNCVDNLMQHYIGRFFYIKATASIRNNNSCLNSLADINLARVNYSGQL